MAISQPIRLEIAPDAEFNFTQLIVHVEKESNVLLQILAEQGALIWTLFSGVLKVGKHIFPIHSEQLDNGPYLVQAKVDGSPIAQLYLDSILCNRNF